MEVEGVFLRKSSLPSQSMKRSLLISQADLDASVEESKRLEKDELLIVE